MHTPTPSPESLRPHPDESACLERGNQNDLRVCLLSPEETPFYIGDCDFQTRARGIKKKLADRIGLGGGKGVGRRVRRERSRAGSGSASLLSASPNTS